MRRGKSPEITDVSSRRATIRSHRPHRHFCAQIAAKISAVFRGDAAIPEQTRRRLLGLAAAGVFVGAAAPANAVEIGDYFGTWSGVYRKDGFSINFRLLIRDASTVFLTAVDKGGTEMRATQVSLAPDSIAFEVAFGGRWSGAMSGAGILKLSSAGLQETVDFARGDLFPPKPLSREAVSRARQASGAPAMGAAFARNGGAATVMVDGLRSAQGAIPVTPDDAWCVASITKSMTATLAARLVQAGAISWETTVAEILGPSVPGMHDSYRLASLRNLLNHRAGLRREPDEKAYNSFALDGLDDPRPERLRWASAALAQSPVGPVNGQTFYSNSGYVVAAAMLEAIRKKPWEALMTEEVFSPLGLASAGFGAPGIPGKLDQPLGHSRATPDSPTPIPAQLGPGKVAATPVAKGPAGRVHISLPDLIAYLNAHLERPSSFLRPDLWTTLQTSAGGDYAMGWEVRADGKLAHDGSNGFWYANVAIDPANRTVAAAVANDGAAQTAWALGELIPSALLSARS
jgi:CubicO group peptidase (beta-lactamase class C family)